MPPKANANEVVEGLTTMVLAIRADPHLSRWFETLEGLATPQRQVEILRMRRNIVLRDIDDVANSLVLLMDERVFAAAVQAYRSIH